MKARWGLIALASGALALGLLAPGAVTAAPQATKPSGEALVRIDGGDAQAIKRKTHVYRVVLPKESTITWLGEVNRKLTSGTLGRKGLVAGWIRLGHSASGKGAMTTITWKAPGDEKVSNAGAYIAMPKIDGEGRLTFLATTVQALPKDLPNFSLNIARPIHGMSGPTVRGGYPLAFPANAASSTVGVQATATSDSAATIVFGNVSNGKITTACPKPATFVSSSSSNYVTFYGTCGDTTWTTGEVDFGSGGGIATVYMSATIAVKGGNPPTFNWGFNMGQWKSGGVQVWP